MSILSPGPNPCFLTYWHYSTISNILSGLLKVFMQEISLQGISLKLTSLAQVHNEKFNPALIL